MTRRDLLLFASLVGFDRGRELGFRLLRECLLSDKSVAPAFFLEKTGISPES
jgi:hypothetical protein